MAAAVIGAVLAVPGPARAERSLAEQLRRAAGTQPIVLVHAGQTVVAKTPDGSFERVLVEEASNVQFDAARELLWFRKADALWVLSLREARPLPRVIVDNLGGARINVEHPGEPGPRYWEVRLVWKPGPRVEPNLTFYDAAIEGPVDEERARAVAAERAKLARGARIVGRCWLAANFERPRRAGPRLGRFDRTLEGHEYRECRPGTFYDPCSEDATGRAAAFPGGRFLIVAVGYDCDHAGCVLTCNLYDRRARRWALMNLETDWTDAPQDAAGSHSPCNVTSDSSGTMYTTPVRVCHVERGCEDWTRTKTRRGYQQIIGWLDPGIYLVAP